MTRPLDPQTLVFGIATARDPRLSPDGTRVLYTVRTVDPATRRSRGRAWICGIDGSAPEPLGLDAESVGIVRWAPDGERILLTHEDDDGSALVVSNVSDGAPIELVRHRRRIEDAVWSPDAGHIAYVMAWDPDNPDDAPDAPGAAPPVRVTRRLDYKADGRGYLGDKRSHLFVVDVRNGVHRRVSTELQDHDGPQWAPHARIMAVRRSSSDPRGSHLLLVDLDAGASTCVTPEDATVEAWAWSPAGDRILYAGDEGHTLQPDFFLYDVATGARRRLTHDIKWVPDDRAAPAQPQWLDDGHALVHGYVHAASELLLLDVETGALETVHRWEARNRGLNVDQDARYVALGESTLEATGEIAVFERATAKTTRITAHNADVFRASPPAQWERFEVDRGEVAIDGWLLLPPDFDPGKRYPVVLDVHGGPTASYGYGFIAHEQCLATNGFLVVTGNPRGSNSYGRDFARAIIRDWGGVDYHDVLALLDAVLERPYADETRTGIFGISFGGYMTAWAISQSDRFQAAVCGEPIFDLESDYGTSDVAYNGLELFGGGPPHAEREWYTARSPSTFAHRTTTPTLLFHGEADERCPIGQSEQMFVALKKAGCEVEYVRYPGGSHMFFAQGLPDHQADFLARTLGWFKGHLGDPA